MRWASSALKRAAVCPSSISTCSLAPGAPGLAAKDVPVWSALRHVDPSQVSHKIAVITAVIRLPA